MNKKTTALTTEQYKEIINTMKTGFCGFRPNERIATALVLEGNLGLRISDIVKLRLCDIIRDGDRYRLEITEQKTGKKRLQMQRNNRRKKERVCLLSWAIMFLSVATHRRGRKQRTEKASLSGRWWM